MKATDEASGLRCFREESTAAETVEKVPQQLLGWDAEKNDLTESTTINDLIMMRGHGDPRKPPINYTEGFFDSLAINLQFFSR